MTPSRPRRSSVIPIFGREAGRGETEGRKDRPVTVGVRLPRPDGDLVVFSRSPRSSRKRPALRRKSPPSRNGGPGSMQICGSGSSSMSSTATSSAALLPRARTTTRPVQQGLLPSPSPGVYRASQIVYRNQPVQIVHEGFPSRIAGFGRISRSADRNQVKEWWSDLPNSSDEAVALEAV